MIAFLFRYLYLSQISNSFTPQFFGQLTTAGELPTLEPMRIPELPPWLTDLFAVEHAGGCLTLPEGPLPGSGRALALAPHPDDPDAVAVLLRMLQQGGWEVYWTILTSGWSGVEDDFVGPTREAKARIREEEERAAARLFGLPEDRLSFLRLEEGADGHLRPHEANIFHFSTHLDTLNPALVILPYHHDSNPSHRLANAWLTRWAEATENYPITLENEDPKSEYFQPNLRILFGEATAVWKTALLECHRSQSLRNQHVRRMTFADRILQMNAADSTLRPGEFVERYRVASFSPSDSSM